MRKADCADALCQLANADEGGWAAGAGAGVVLTLPGLLGAGDEAATEAGAAVAVAEAALSMGAPAAGVAEVIAVVDFALGGGDAAPVEVRAETAEAGAADAFLAT
ncbi:MAG: hypothetical protein ACRD1Y_03145 [Terriglobales bacterium]